MATTCCPTTVGPVQSDYKPKGSTVTTAGGTTMYVVGDAATKRAIVATYDIFGMHNVTCQVCDLLAAAGFLVVLPDFFQGKPFPLEPWPPVEGFGTLMKWIGEVGTWEVLRPMFVDSVAWVRSQGIADDKIGGIGFCWGAKPMFAACKEGLVHVVASPHPSFLSTEDVNPCQSPVCLLPTKDDPPMDDIKAVLEAKPFAHDNVFRRFDDMHHGFLAARGNWADPHQAQRATEAIQILVNFFTATMK